MVMTTSEALTASSVSGLGNSLEISRPSSAIASTTAGLSWSAGCDPADRTTTRPAAWWSSSAAAICERPALWMQTNKTSGVVSDMGSAGWFWYGEQCGDPLLSFRQRPVVDPRSAALAVDQSGLAQHSQVVG